MKKTDKNKTKNGNKKKKSSNKSETFDILNNSDYPDVIKEKVQKKTPAGGRIVCCEWHCYKGRYAVFYVTNLKPSEAKPHEIMDALYEFDPDFFMDNFFVDSNETKIHIYGRERTKQRFLKEIEEFKLEHKDDDSEWVKQEIKHMEGVFDYMDSLKPMYLLSLVSMLRNLKYNKEIDKIEGELTKYPLFLDVLTAYDYSLGLTAEDVFG